VPAASTPLLKYNKTNLRRVSKTIVRNLTPDLLPLKYIVKNSKNPMFGHCHTASGCLYKIFGSQSLHMYRALDPHGIWHWWVVDRERRIIDLTADQYPRKTVTVLYRKGTKSGMLGFAYRKRVLELFERVRHCLEV
jgi:hypothetical protein